MAGRSNSATTAPAAGSSWRDVKRHAGERTILGSGDLFSAADCLRMIHETGVDGVTVARGAIGNPWVFAQARALAAGEPQPPPPTIGEQAAVLAEHYELAESLYGERCGALLRKFGIKYAALHPDYEEVRTAFARTQGREGWMAVLDRYYYQRPGPGRYPDPSIHRVQASCKI